MAVSRVNYVLFYANGRSRYSEMRGKKGATSKRDTVSDRPSFQPLGTVPIGRASRLCPGLVGRPATLQSWPVRPGALEKPK
jgi:hypothetical protein